MDKLISINKNHRHEPQYTVGGFVMIIESK